MRFVQPTKNIYWILYCDCWFGFYERAHFVKSESGGYFAKEHTTEFICSVKQNGFREPDFNLPHNLK